VDNVLRCVDRCAVNAIPKRLVTHKDCRDAFLKMLESAIAIEFGCNRVGSNVDWDIIIDTVCPVDRLTYQCIDLKYVLFAKKVDICFDFDKHEVELSVQGTVGEVFGEVKKKLEPLKDMEEELFGYLQKEWDQGYELYFVDVKDL
jgi:hypothetical protein